MAHGLPDWYRGVDIAYQSLALLLQRPTYGAATRTAGSVGGIGSGQTTLCTISGEGMTYGGFVRLSAGGSHLNDAIRFEIDGVWFCQQYWSQLNTYNMVLPRGYPMALTKCDDTNFIYCVEFSYGITFESELKLIYDRAGASPASNLYYELVYALV